jgi:hypothetical protein
VACRGAAKIPGVSIGNPHQYPCRKLVRMRKDR